MRKFTVIAVLFATAAGLNSVSAQEDLSEVVFTPHFIRISENGGVLEKTWPQLSTPEFKAAVGVACAALGCAPLVTTILANVGRIPITSGGDYATSGHIDKQAGEQWLISFHLLVTQPSARRTTARQFQRIRVTQLAGQYSAVQKGTGSVPTTKSLNVALRDIGFQ